MKMKKVLALVLAVTMLVSVVPVSVSAVSLTDISNHWSVNSVQRWVDAEILTGYPDGFFRPNKEITRAEFAHILVKNLGLTGTSSKVFPDVAEGHWASASINACAANGIVNGYDDGSFKPNRFITRVEAMAMFVRAMKVDMDFTKEYALEYLAELFKDSDKIPGWGCQYAAAMVNIGAMQGSDQKLNPVSNITRGEVATILDRMLVVYVSKSGKISTTTDKEAKKGMQCNIVVVHPDASATVKTGENGEITVTAGDETVQAQTHDGMTPFVLSGNDGIWAYDCQIVVNKGEMEQSITQYLVVRDRNIYQSGDDPELDQNTLTEYFYDEEIWQINKVVETETDGTVRVKTAEFDDQGRPVKAFDNDALAMEFFYQDDMLVKQIRYDSDGKQDAVTTYEWKVVDGYDVYRVEFATDPAALWAYRSVRETYYDESGTQIKELTENETCNNDLGGRTLEKEEIHYKNGELSTRVYERYEEGYDPSAPEERLVKRSTEEYFYGEHGLEKLIYVNDQIGLDTYTEIHLYTYDEEGNKISYLHTDAEGNQVCKYLFFTEYTETGYETLEERYDEQNVLSSKSIEKVNEQTNERWCDLYDLEADEQVNDCYSVGKEVDGQWIYTTEDIIYGSKYSSETVYDLVVLPEDHIVQDWYFF